MTIKKYKKGTPSVLSAYFKSTEFDCSGKNCCSETLVSAELITVLTKIRQRFGGPVIINSGYRCKEHNTAVGGAKSSKHIEGTAADIKVKDTNGKYVDPIKVGVFVDSLFYNRYGIEVGSYGASTDGYIHIDVRPGKWRAIKPNSNSNKYTTYDTLTPTVRLGSKGDAVLVLSRKLKHLGYFNKTPSSTFSAELQGAVIDFQRKNGLTADGICGPRTWAKIVGLI